MKSPMLLIVIVWTLAALLLLATAPARGDPLTRQAPEAFPHLRMPDTIVEGELVRIRSACRTLAAARVWSEAFESVALRDQDGPRSSHSRAFANALIEEGVCSNYANVQSIVLEVYPRVYRVGKRAWLRVIKVVLQTGDIAYSFYPAEEPKPT